MHMHEELRPHPTTLTLLLRAAVADVEAGDTWLCIARDLAGRVIRPYLATTFQPGAFHRLPMISGADALAFAVEHNWPDVLAPSLPELRGLMVHAMLTNDAALWFADYDRWEAWVLSPEGTRRRIEREDNARSVVRGLRWKLAEQWLARA